MSMSRFAAALTSWMDLEVRISIRKLSEMTQITGPDLSLMRKGTRGVNVNMMTRLMQGIKEHYGIEPALRLLIAHLRDETPEPYQGAVKIEAKLTPGSTSPSSPTALALSYFARRASVDAEFAAWIVQLHDLCGDVLPKEEPQASLTTIATVLSDEPTEYGVNSDFARPQSPDNAAETSMSDRLRHRAQANPSSRPSEAASPSHKPQPTP